MSLSGESPAWPPVRQDISELAEPFVCRMETIHELSIAACAHSLAVSLTLKNSIVLTREEGAVLTLLGAAAILWSAVLMVLGLKVVHEFSFGRTVLAVLYSLIGILIILFLALLLWSLFQQLAMFLVSLYDELSLKLK